MAGRQLPSSKRRTADALISKTLPTPSSLSNFLRPKDLRCDLEKPRPKRTASDPVASYERRDAAEVHSSLASPRRAQWDPIGDAENMVGVLKLMYQVWRFCFAINYCNYLLSCFLVDRQ